MLVMTLGSSGSRVGDLKGGKHSWKRHGYWLSGVTKGARNGHHVRMPNSAKRARRLWDAYVFPGFRPHPTVRGIFGDPQARMITLVRRSKNALRLLWARAVGLVRPTSSLGSRSVVRRPAHLPGVRGPAGALPRCGTVKRERVHFLRDNPCNNKRFAYYVGRRCRSATIKDFAQELKLDWDTVKTLEKQSRRRSWPRRARQPRRP